jgi:sterol desaturase/sphingolipid hydroxylase (fatty acid hydroxylase superfamily)
MSGEAIRNIALHLFLVIALGEGLIQTYRRGHYDWKAFGVSLLDRIMGFGVRIWLPFTLAGPVLAYLYDHHLFQISLDNWGTFAFLLVGQDFFYYWFHRESHLIRWFWASHVVHHSSNELNFAAAFRLGITERISGSTLFYVPLAWLGFDPKIIFSVAAFNLVYQYWIHADWIPKLGALEFFLNTPSHHRVHHSRELAHLDCNYGGVLIIWDRLFGTFVEETEDVPVRYGLVKPITTYNPLYIEFHEWRAMFHDVLHATSLKHAIGFLLGHPGWSPNGDGLTTENLRIRSKMADSAASA